MNNLNHSAKFPLTAQSKTIWFARDPECQVDKNPHCAPGQRFGRLVLISEAAKRGYRRHWNCLCDCGTEKIVWSASLRCGRTKSCGCLHRDICVEYNTTHGLSKTPLYSVWRGMIARCSEPQHKAYKNYGGRGIKVCDEWQDPASFYEWGLVGYAPGLSLDRINCNGHYSPDNCRWASRATQARNTRRNITAPSGELWVEVAQKNGISQSNFYNRYARGWAPERAATHPVRAA